MLRYKTYQQSFVIAALVILLCLICLVGATLALFTSNVNDGTIGIVTTAGFVKVDIVDTSDMPESLVDKVLNFQTSSEQPRILFEPGATFYTQGFRIQNKGDIPIRFRLYISEDETIDMTEFKEAFEFGLTTDPTNLENFNELPPFQGKLEVGEMSETYYLVIRMKDTVGNEFQGKTYTGIGITVYAVQGNIDIEE